MGVIITKLNKCNVDIESVNISELSPQLLMDLNFGFKTLITLKL